MSLIGTFLKQVVGLDKPEVKVVDATELGRMVREATSKSDIDEIVRVASQNGMLTENLVDRLTSRNDAIEARRITEQSRATNGGYWDYSPKENAQSAREWNDKAEREELENFKLRIESLDLGQLYSFQYNERKKIQRSELLCNDEKLNLINKRITQFKERR